MLRIKIQIIGVKKEKDLKTKKDRLKVEKVVYEQFEKNGAYDEHKIYTELPTLCL